MKRTLLLLLLLVFACLETNNYNFNLGDNLDKEIYEATEGLLQEKVFREKYLMWIKDYDSHNDTLRYVVYQAKNIHSDIAYEKVFKIKDYWVFLEEKTKQDKEKLIDFIDLNNLNKVNAPSWLMFNSNSVTVQIYKDSLGAYEHSIDFYIKKSLNN